MLNITSAIKTIRVNEIVKKTNDKVIDKVMDELSNKKDAIKWTSKPSNNGLLTIRKNKVALTLYQTTYVGRCLLDLSVNVLVPLWLH